jgi:hypothetical protein
MALAGAEQTELLPQLLADRGVSRFIALHKSGGYQWFIRERWELLLEWLELVSLAAAAGDGLPAATVAAAAARKRLLAAAAVAGYRLDLVLAGAPC